MDKDGKVKIDIVILSVLIIAVITFAWLFVVTHNAYDRLLDHADRQNKFIKELYERSRNTNTASDSDKLQN